MYKIKIVEGNIADGLEEKVNAEIEKKICDTEDIYEDDVEVECTFFESGKGIVVIKYDTYGHDDDENEDF